MRHRLSGGNVPRRGPRWANTSILALAMLLFSVWTASVSACWHLRRRCNAVMLQSTHYQARCLADHYFVGRQWAGYYCGPSIGEAGSEKQNHYNQWRSGHEGIYWNGPCIPGGYTH